MSHNMKVCGVVEGKRHVFIFITSAPDGGMISFMLQVLLYLCRRVILMECCRGNPVPLAGIDANSTGHTHSQGNCSGSISIVMLSTFLLPFLFLEQNFWVSSRFPETWFCFVSCIWCLVLRCNLTCVAVNVSKIMSRLSWHLSIQG